MRALLLAALLSLAVLAGCTAPAPEADATPPAGDGIANVGGSGKSVTAVFPGTYDFTGPFSNVLTAGPLKIKAPQRVMVPSPIDGSDIELGLHLPDTTGP